MKNTIPSIEDCENFLRGAGPVNSLDKALLAKMSAAELRRKIAEEKKSMEGYLKSLEAVRPKNQPQPPARRPAPAPASKAPAPAAARPLKGESTAVLARAIRMPGISEADKAAARAELEARGVHIMPKGGYSQSIR
jgi:hypothetical protein